MRAAPWRAPALGLAVLALAALSLARQQADGAGVEHFETTIRPLLAEHCTRCHGAERQRSGLRLDGPAGIRAGGERGAVVVPGEPDASRLVVAVRYHDEELAMPPKAKLPDELVATLEEWVAMGAPMPAGEAAVADEATPDDWARRLEHWAFQPVQRVEPPGTDASPIDAFIRAKQRELGLEPAPPADRATLLRRLSFALVGLPPTPDELDAFITNDAPDAYEREVDRLLASPQFGVRWGRHWLDLVRYAETRGHEFDLPLANAWQYRDYVVRALNADVPYDRFVAEHVAGDLQPEPRLNQERGFDESVLGTGFWFLGESVHSPVDVRADQTDRVANQVDVFSKAFLGLTAACARCHDHKFDPITSEEYYALCGYPLSASYRQVRFETDAHNGRIARELDALEREHGGRVVRTVGRELLASVERFDEQLLAAAETVRRGPLELAPSEVIPPEGDFLFDDFERAAWVSWTATGEAFGAGPIGVDALPEHLGDVRARGRHLVQSHDPRATDGMRAADALTGTLTSRPFLVSRDYIHFLVGGGSDPERTAVELVVEGEVVRRASGRDDHRMKAARFDTAALRGREARLRVVDAHDGAWGSVALDHVVFSDSADASALDLERVLPEGAGLAARGGEVAAERGLEPARVAGLAAALRVACDDPTHALRPFAERALPDRVVAADAPVERARPDLTALELPENAVVHADWRRADAWWRADGWRFGLRPVRIGEARFGTDPERPIAGLCDASAASTDPDFAGLTLAPGVVGEGTGIDWVQAGQTLRSATFELGGGKLSLLVRGAGRAYASVCQHRTVHGPLHKNLLKRWDEDPGGWRWVEMDLSPDAGERCHVELSPADGELEVALVVEASRAPAPLRVVPELDVNDERALCDALVRATRLMAEGFLSETPMDPRLVRLASWAASSPDVLLSADARARVRAVAEPLVARRAERLAEIQRESHTAPAMLEGSGVDEYLLARGSHRSPVTPARRRLIEAACAMEQPVIEAGSGRLALAERLTDPSNPLVARVLANRVWHHLFGRGIVPTVDDFGHMGEPPSHPALLDWLASELVRDGWSVKRLIRRIVLSETWRQASAGDPRAAELDPSNVLLARAPVRRLEAEAIRDAILAVCGQLDPAIGGPPVAVHLTPFMGGRGRPPKSGPLNGARRRSLYLEVRRNFLPPSFLVFDFPTPATCNGRRGVSNVPAQALALMNDPFVVNQAAVWGRRVLEAPFPDDAARVDELFRRAFARRASDGERALALAFVAEQQASYERLPLDRDPAVRGPDPRERAWGDLCHVLYNDKDFLFLR